MKILYFVKGGVPTAKQKAEAADMGALIRNANITSGDFVERCDAVAGDVPEAYAKFRREIPGKPAAETDAGKSESVPGGTGEESLFAKMTGPQLREYAAANGIEIPSELTKVGDIRAFLEKQQAEKGSDA